MNATFRLMQDSGVQGPQRTVEVEDSHHADELAVAWSLSQLGHPWDVLTVEVPDLEYSAEIRPVSGFVEA